MSAVVPGVCRDCSSCRSNLATKGAYLFGVAPFMLLIHVATMGLTLIFQRKCPICRHRQARHKGDPMTRQAPPPVVIVGADETPGQPVPVVPVEEVRLSQSRTRRPDRHHA